MGGNYAALIGLAVTVLVGGAFGTTTILEPQLRSTVRVFVPTLTCVRSSIVTNVAG